MKEGRWTRGRGQMDIGEGQVKKGAAAEEKNLQLNKG